MNSHEYAQELEVRFHDLEGAPLLDAMINEVFGDKICLVSSFGIESAVLISMVADINPSLPVIFIDTKKLFPETLAYRDGLTSHLGLKDVRTYYPDYTDIMRKDTDGKLWQQNPNGCCYIRKVKPLERALEGFDAWITGRKQFQGGQRSVLPVIEAFNGRIKINPLARFSMEDLDKIFSEKDLPRHPLGAEGYLSVGCVPCTSLPSDPDDTRSGRWKGQEKTECGIHIDSAGKIHRTSRSE